MKKIDRYFKETLQELKDCKNYDKNPRPKYADGTPAHSKFITQKVFQYDISKGEFPINSLRPTAIKGGWYDMEAIYIKQTNIIEQMNPMIHSWWVDFVTDRVYRYTDCEEGDYVKGFDDSFKEVADKNGRSYEIDSSFIGQTYGHTVKRYDLVDTLLEGLEKNPFGRRHIINIWDNHQMEQDEKALPPCAFQTLWSVRDVHSEPKLVRYIDLTLIQRSMDCLMTFSINPTQYTMLGMAVCGHLTSVTGIQHELGKFLHVVQNMHIYDRHEWALEELLEREPLDEQATIRLKVNKNFYEYTIDDFEIIIPKGIEKLSKNLELAI